ncbi:MAG TPA: oxygenase MpaB family protein [Streptosporangiaceae bacterium]|nr:oxygenase MpaB family protein [Streptosporangiaceae bacterium]
MTYMPYVYTNPHDPARTDDGLFGPGSVTWRIMTSRIMWVAVVRALYLQALHPRVIRGTLQNAPALTEPVDAWSRLRRTRSFIETRTFGTTAEAERAGRLVRMVHEPLTGTDPDGTRYRVDDPGLLLWVHCGEVASCADIARRSRLPFSAADLDAFVAEQRISAELIGADPATAPASMAELGAYYERMKPALYACDEAKQALRLTFRPPVPDGNRALKLGLPPVSALAFATLPRWARQLYDRPDGPLSDMAATAGLRAARLAFDQQWLFRPAMRAVHRAETAGDAQLPPPLT